MINDDVSLLICLVDNGSNLRFSEQQVCLRVMRNLEGGSTIAKCLNDIEMHFKYKSAASIKKYIQSKYN